MAHYKIINGEPVEVTNEQQIPSQILTQSIPLQRVIAPTPPIAPILKLDVVPGKKVRRFGDKTLDWYVIACPACGEHVIAVSPPFSNGAAWGFNYNFDKPTFSPSLLVRTGKMADPSHVMSEGTMGERWNRICHSFIMDGMIRFLADCTHELAGQTVPLLDVTER